MFCQNNKTVLQCTGKVKEMVNTCMDLDSSTASDVEEVPIPNFRDSISARKLMMCSASEEQLTQTNVSMAQSVCEFLQHPKPSSDCDMSTSVSISDEQPTGETNRHFQTVMCCGGCGLGEQDCIY